MAYVRLAEKFAKAVVLSSFLGVFLCAHVDVEAKTTLSQQEYQYRIGTYSIDDSILHYQDYQAQFESSFPDGEYEMKGSSFVRYEEDGVSLEPEILSNYMDIPGGGDAVVTKENSLIEYEVQIEEEGFYNLSLLYYPIAGNSAQIQRSIFVDGVLPYDQLALVEFARIWTNEIVESYENEDGIMVKKWNVDNQGNDLKPSSVEAPEWVETNLYDAEGYITTPLSIYLTKGSHTITFVSQREPMVIGALKLNNLKPLKTYDETKAELDASGVADSHGQLIRIEAENVNKTSSQMLYPQQDQGSPAIYPSSAKALKNNSIGGNSWRLIGQWLEYEFEVQEEGYYHIALYAKQNFSRGTYVSRKIYLDGQVPFQELNNYGFSYEQNWREDVLSDKEGEPYKIYLTKGTHTLRMEAVLGDFSQVISEVQESVTALNSIYRKVIRITGVAPDVYRDYQIETSLPELEQELIAVRDKLSNAITNLREFAGKGSDKESVLRTMRDQLNELIEDQERFVEVIASYKVNMRATGNWITSAIQQPLQLDRIYIYSPDETTDISNTGFFAKVFYEVKRLFYSFIIDYNQIGNVAKESEAKEADTITLWIGSGRDQANVIKSLIDETFTNQTGINVNVQLVDMSTLLRATLVGEGPDVAIQVANTTGIAGAVLNTGNDTPVNYGLRNAVLDLTMFEDLEEVKQRFPESAMVAFEFDSATYGLPETITFPMMFYRKDILSELGMEVPTTWDEVKVAMTILAKNQMEFAMLPNEQTFAMLLFQNGGRYYRDAVIDGILYEGIESDLDSDIAVNTFKQYCEFYTDYKLDKETSVEERFRTGESPIMIADYTTYNNLIISAPDLKGLWDFAPVPGVVYTDENGQEQVNHATGCTGLASIIMADTEYPDACWEFLKWWTSAETQVVYGREMESLMGASARVPTANLEAFASLPWPLEDKKALLEQLEAVQGIPQVPGGYYSWRNVNNAFYSVTVSTNIDTASTREELMDKIIFVNKEIDFKRKEFKLPLAEEIETK